MNSSNTSLTDARPFQPLLLSSFFSSIYIYAKPLFKLDTKLSLTRHGMQTEVSGPTCDLLSAPIHRWNNAPHGGLPLFHGELRLHPDTSRKPGSTHRRSLAIQHLINGRARIRGILLFPSSETCPPTSTPNQKRTMFDISTARTPWSLRTIELRPYMMMAMEEGLGIRLASCSLAPRPRMEI
jgi:hypothetical protein